MQFGALFKLRPSAQDKLTLLVKPCEDKEELDLEEHILGRLLLTCAMLGRAPLLSSSIGLLAMARHLLPWVCQAAAVDLHSVGSLQLAGRIGPIDLARSAVLAVITASSSFTVNNDDPEAEEAWQESTSQLYIMGRLLPSAAALLFLFSASDILPPKLSSWPCSLQPPSGIAAPRLVSARLLAVKLVPRSSYAAAGGPGQPRPGPGSI